MLLLYLKQTHRPAQTIKTEKKSDQCPEKKEKRKKTTKITHLTIAGRKNGHSTKINK